MDRKQIWDGSAEFRSWRGRLWAGCGCSLQPSNFGSLGSGRTERLLGSCLPAEVDPEEGLGESALLQQALHGGGGAPCRQAGVGQAHDAIELCVDKIGPGLGLTEAKLLVGDLNALELEWRLKQSDSDAATWTDLHPPGRLLISPRLNSPPPFPQCNRGRLLSQA